jgi:hypothetical protein
MSYLLHASGCDARVTIYGVMVSVRLDPENISAEVLERVEARQHRPERQGGDDRNAHDRSETSKWA